MSDRPTITAYLYDGSFDGLLCCIFTAIAEKESPADILPENAAQPSLCPPRYIPTDSVHASRVRNSIPKKISSEALYWVENGFLSCLENKERVILDFLRKGYKKGPSITRMLQDETVFCLHKAVQFVDNETHLLKGFIRFAQRNGALTAIISPKNQVLPRLAPHFVQRYPEETFLIYDDTHGMVLTYWNHKCMILPADSIDMPALDEQEAQYEALWKRFYDTIAIEGRYNPRCRMTHCPKRYWHNMTEFCDLSHSSQSLLLPKSNSAASRMISLSKPNQQKDYYC